MRKIVNKIWELFGEIDQPGFHHECFFYIPLPRQNIHYHSGYNDME